MYGIDNEGVELEVKGELVRGRTWQWNLSFNVSRNRNRLARSLNGRDFQNTAASRCVFLRLCHYCLTALNQLTDHV